MLLLNTSSQPKVISLSVSIALIIFLSAQVEEITSRRENFGAKPLPLLNEANQIVEPDSQLNASLVLTQVGPPPECRGQATASAAKELK